MLIRSNFCGKPTAAAAMLTVLIYSNLWVMGFAFTPPATPSTYQSSNGNRIIPRTYHEKGSPISLVRLNAAPKRLKENVDGVLYVNEKCINCAACSSFAPSIFGRAVDTAAHVVHTQPQSSKLESTNNDNKNIKKELDEARAAMAACPVAAIRVDTEAHRHHRGMGSLTKDEQELAKSLALSTKVNGLDLPFPRQAFDGMEDIHYVGYHNDRSFGAIPYLVQGVFRGEQVWVMVDTPRFTPQSVRTVTSLTGPSGPDYLFLTHVDDTADHGKWADEFPSLKRIFHSGDAFGSYNWIGDETLQNVEVFLSSSSSDNGGVDDNDRNTEFQTWALDGSPTAKADAQSSDFVIWHTPGHSPGSISLLKKRSGESNGVLFTGDTYAYSTRNGGQMSGFPLYNKGGRELQAQILQKIVHHSDQWDIIAPGHGHARDYRNQSEELKLKDLNDAIEGLTSSSRR